MSFPKRNYTRPGTNEIKADCVAEVGARWAAIRSKNGSNAERAAALAKYTAEAEAVAKLEQIKFSRHTRAAQIDFVDECIGMNAPTSGIDGEHRDHVIRAVIFNSPAILNIGGYSNQLAANFIGAFYYKDHETYARMMADCRMAADCLPYLIALNSPGRAMLADLHAQFAPLSIAAE